MRIFLITGACIALLSLGFAAQAESRSEKAEKVFALALRPETIGDMGARTGRLIADQIDSALKAKGKSLSESDRNQLIVRFAVAFASVMDSVMPDILKIYGEEFSDRELDLMLEMYSDPEIASLMTKMPLVMERLMPAIQAPALAMTQQIIQDMKNEGLLSNL